ncbi:MAG: acetyl-CoA carboxylase biotin carboxylase subunit [Fimbriimonadia bacterium]|jgi:acetyl-CoA carboxylase biotin carboxylase subunit
MFKKVLIANRGEIAVRIIRACRELGISTVAVYSEADRDALHVRLADESVCVGSGPNGESYLVDSNVLMAAQITGADAIHPGYGYFAENATFAEGCAALGITFIGPSPDTLERMGEKVMARKIAAEQGVPIPPGTLDPVADEAHALQEAQRIGFPLLVKAAAGGGGRGIRRVESLDELVTALSNAQSEAAAAFGNGDVYLERCLVEPRHVEVQIMGDRHGNVVHLFERDCSVQNLRHQKLIEEAPCPAIDDEVRIRMGEDAVRLAKAVDYVGAGTVEFLVDRDHNHYFIEMNTRLQVEHPVTEELVGRDIVRKQILAAAGEPLGFVQSEVQRKGHVIEARLTAQDPDRDFSPSCGTVTEWVVPGGLGVRVDTFGHSGAVIPPYYDPMIAKVIVWDADRPRAIVRLRRALCEFVIGGIKTNRDLLIQIVDSDEFREGRWSTETLQRLMRGAAVSGSGL